MAAGDIKVLKGGYGAQRFRTETNIKLGAAAGDAFILAGTGTNFVDLLLTGMPTQGTDIFVGISTGNPGDASIANTASADGRIDIILVGPGTILQGKATTTTNINTDAKLKLLLNDYVNFDRSAATASGILTIDEDENAGASGTLSLMILDGDIVSGDLRVATVNSNIWTGTM